VPTQFPTIQQAINASSNGDTVLVLPGTYVENLFISRSVVVRSAQGPATAVIDGGQPDDPDLGSVVRMSQGTLQGFDIRNGSGSVWTATATRLGGGVLVQDGVSPGPIIRNNWIHGNRVEESARLAYGGGIAMRTPGQVVGNRIFTNTVKSTTRNATGAGIWGNGLISSNEIFDNRVTMAGGAYWGGTTLVGEGTIDHNVIACNSGHHAAALSTGGVAEHNTIVANWSASNDAAVYLSDQNVDQLVVFLNNNVTQNIAAGVTCFAPQPTFTFDIECNNVFGNSPSGQMVGDCSDMIGLDGNVSVDPQYGRGNCPPAPGDFCLGPGSPLLPENSPSGCGLIGALGLCSSISVSDAGAPPSDDGSLMVRPNPFRNRTMIAFQLPEAGPVEVAIYGVQGRRVRLLKQGTAPAGDCEVPWDALDDSGVRVAAGGYVAVIHAGKRELTRTLLLIR
jgi:hypothetical protein